MAGGGDLRRTAGGAVSFLRNFGAAVWGGESSLYVEQVLEYGKRMYSGVARLGVEALELKIAGYSGTDIAKLYGVQPNHVGAWISRAAQKLKKDLFLVENGSTNP